MSSPSMTVPINVPDYVSVTHFDSKQFIFNINLFLLAVVATFVVYHLPRLTARCYAEGGTLFLRTGAAHRRPRPAAFIAAASDKATNGYTDTYDDRSDDSHTHLTYRPTFNFPPHVSPCPRRLQFLVVLFRKRVASSTSLGQVTLLCGLMAVLLYAGFYRDPEMVFLDPQRTGWIGVGVLAWTVVFAVKNGVIGWLLGHGYEKLNWLHRFAGRVTVIASNIHALDYFYKWNFLGTVNTEFKQAKHVWGLVALIAVNILFTFSLSDVRRRSYRLFYLSHMLGFVTLLVGVWFHYSDARLYIIISAGLYGADVAVRITKTRITTAFVRSAPHFGAARIECRTIRGGWRGGQHVRVRVLGGGFWDIFGAAHPFTICSTTTSNDGLVLLAKKNEPGSWTQKLFEYADERRAAAHGRKIRLMIEGPYGGPSTHSNIIMESFSALALIVGGSGISWALGIIKEMMQRDMEGKCRVKICRIVWVNRDLKGMKDLAGEFLDILSRGTLGMHLQIEVFYTGAVGEDEGKNPSADFPRGVHVNAGRPSPSTLFKLFDDAITQTCRVHTGGGLFSAKNRGRLRGLCVGVCGGGTSLVDEVVGAVNRLDNERRRKVGGVEVVEEGFGY